MGSPDQYEKIWLIVNQIPAGKVSTYGQVAKLAGMANGARYVGYTLRQLPEDTKLPWHRVISAQGKLALPIHSKGWQEQKQRLIEEGIVFNGEKISLKQFGWRP